MKATYREVKELIDYTDWENQKAFKKGDQPISVHRTGYFAPSGANWAYQFGITRGRDGKVYEVVTVFGEVRGFQQIYLADKSKVVYGQGK